MSITQKKLTELLESLTLLPPVLNQIVVEYNGIALEEIEVLLEQFAPFGKGEEALKFYIDFSNTLKAVKDVRDSRIDSTEGGVSHESGGAQKFQDACRALRDFITKSTMVSSETGFNLIDFINDSQHFLATELLKSTLLFQDIYVAIKLTADECSFLMPLFEIMQFMKGAYSDKALFVGQLKGDAWIKQCMARKFSHIHAGLLFEPAGEGGGTLYVDATRTGEIERLQSISRYQKEWQCFVEKLTPKQLSLAKELQGAWQIIKSPGGSSTDLIAICKEVLAAIMNQAPIIINLRPKAYREAVALFEQQMLFSDPLKVLALLVEGVVHEMRENSPRLGLLDYLESIRKFGRHEEFCYAEPIIAKTLVLANTHARVEADYVFYENLTQYSTLRGPRLTQESTWAQRKDFQDSLNAWLQLQTQEQAAVSLLRIEAEVLVLYVSVTTPRSVAHLTMMAALPSEQFKTMFRMQTVATPLAPKIQLPFLKSTPATAPGKPPDYKAEIMKIIDELQKYKPIETRLSSTSWLARGVMPVAKGKQEFIEKLAKQVTKTVASIKTAQEACDCLASLQAEIEKYRKKNAGILKVDLSGGKPLRDYLTAAHIQAAALIETFQPQKTSVMSAS